MLPLLEGASPAGHCGKVNKRCSVCRRRCRRGDVNGMRLKNHSNYLCQLLILRGYKEGRTNKTLQNGLRHNPYSNSFQLLSCRILDQICSQVLLLIHFNWLLRSCPDNKRLKKSNLTKVRPLFTLSQRGSDHSPLLIVFK